MCKILKDISVSEFADKVYFKGGTSLSKAYMLIFRFSEDLDLFVFTRNPDATKQAEKTLNRRVSKFIQSKNESIYRRDLSETGGNYRKLCFSYNHVYEGVGLKENLEVELKSCDLQDKHTMYYPTDKRIITSIITEYLLVINRPDLVKQFGMESFEFQCINPRKTMCDKISRLVKLSYNDDAVQLIAKHIRDVYDLSVLYYNSSYHTFLRSKDFLEAMYQVTVEDGLTRSSQSHQSLANAIIFKEAKTMMALSEIHAAYNTDLKQLVFDKKQFPPIENSTNALKGIYEELLRFDKYRASLLENNL